MLVSIKKCEDYIFEDVYNTINEGIKELEDLKYLNGKKVLIKPNFLAPKSVEKAVTTHPIIIKAVARIINENGGKVYIGDSPGIGSVKLVSKIIGLDKLIEEENCELVDFSEKIDIKNPKGVLVKNFTIAKIVTEVDYIFNLPKLKTHGMTKYTGAVKNMFGIVPGTLKPQFHYRFPDIENFAQMLVDLNILVKPVFHIMDAIVSMEGNGPGNGTPRKSGLILISKDPIALDTTACRLINLNPEKIFTNTIGEKSGLGTSKNIQIIGEKLEDLIMKDYKHVEKNVDLTKLLPLPKPLKKILKTILVPKPHFLHKKCIMCKECINVCPSSPKSLKIKENKIVINHKTCIRCFCCQEMCPPGAIVLRRFTK